MKIIFLSYYPVLSCTTPDEWFGKLSFYHGYLEELSKCATVHDVAVIGFSGMVERNGVIYHFPKAKKSLLARSLNSYVKRLRPDVVIVHGLMFPLQIILLRRTLGPSVKIFVQHHAEPPLTGWRALVQKNADKYINGYFFADIGVADRWIEKKLLDAGKLHILPEASSVFYPVERAQAMSVTGIRPGKTYLWVGRLNVNKDPATMVKSFIAFLKLQPEARLYMIYSEDDLETELNRSIIDAGVSGNIFLIGKVPHPALLYWYNSADFIVNTSFYEGCNIAVIEGMSCGCIPVVTDIPSFRMHTDGWKIGFRFNPGDVSALTNILIATLSLDIHSERGKVLSYYDRELSPRAISEKILRLAQN